MKVASQITRKNIGFLMHNDLTPGKLPLLHIADQNILQVGQRAL